MCTGVRFTDDKGNLYFGRNLDWSTSYGQKVVITPRGYDHPWCFGIPRTADYAVIGMGIVVDDLPLYFDAANEKGLAVAGLNFPGYAQYETAEVAGKTNVAAYEFPFWVVRNFASVAEAEAALKDVAIVGKQVNEQLPVSMLHWFLSDAERAIVVEYTADGMQLYDDTVGVLTNQPGFPWHMENLRNYMNLSPECVQNVKWGQDVLEPYGSGIGMRGLPGDYYSPSRFVRAAYTNAYYTPEQGEQANVMRVFHTLQGVAMLDGCAKMTDGNYEKSLYTGAYSTATKCYYYTTYEDLNIVKHSMDEADLDGTAPHICE